MTVQNDTAAPLTIDLFAYCDVDHCGTANGDSASGTPDRHTISDAGCAAADVEFFGVQPSHYMVGDWPNVLDALVDNAAGDLPDAGLPYTAAADYTGAMQFTSPTLLPGERFHAVAAISHGYAFVFCGTIASTRNYGVGLAGAGGVPTITASTEAVVGSNLIFTIANAPPGANGALFYGESQIFGDAGFNVFGLNFYVAVNVEPIIADPNGVVRLQLNLPIRSNGLCGQRFHFNAFFQDPTSPASPFPLINSDVLEFTIGQ
jgi:hypothetical protein